jgi:hypothetical protein
MPEVRADPDKLRQFASTLTRSAQQLEAISRQLRRSLDATGWDDSERKRFEDDFRMTVRSLSAFTERLRDSYAPQLRKKADALDRFRG